MKKEILRSFCAFFLFSVICSVIYPLSVWVFGEFAFHHKAHGSLVKQNEQVVGSMLIAQNFTNENYFHPRPSSAGSGYDAQNSSASNLGPTSDALIKAIQNRLINYRKENNMNDSLPVPNDAVMSSGSGLDPHISVTNAIQQSFRVASSRSMNHDDLLKILNDHIEKPFLGFIGEARVNVLKLNLALDKNM